MHMPSYELGPVLYTGLEIIVRRGRRKTDGAPVTLKMLRTEAPDARQIARLRHEWLVTRHLDLPCVVRVLGIEQSGSMVGLVLEHFEGQSLDELLREARLDLRKKLQIALALASAVAKLHAQHVIHKDIKPQNILVDVASSTVKLTDFGIAARLSEETAGVLRPDHLEGTLAYISPEQTGRMSRVVDDRTDQYSLGATLYQLFTGRLPFESHDAAELVHAHLAKMPIPPHELSPEVPSVVSAIVMKLLSKDAEDRYQGARGVAEDLGACLARLDKEGTIAPFPLGQRDAASVLRIPQKLYGRGREIDALKNAFSRCSAGAREIIVLSGYAGIGKSALVGEVRRAIAARGGYLAAGKFDQQGRNAPYAAVMEALRGLFRRILGEPEATLARFRDRLSNALGANGLLVTELVPELVQIIGALPAVPTLGPTEAQNRFQMTLQEFLRALSCEARPLVLFLDDLQWADPASLKLIELALVDPDCEHLLVIGAYRDQEVDATHPLTSTLANLREAGVSLGEMKLGPLAPEHVARFVADAVGRPLEEVAPLATLAFEKTHGNPFFLGQFLKGLAAEGLLRFDESAGALAWDLAQIRGQAATDNVIDFMAQRVRALPETTQRVLRLAACIGHTFDLATLSAIAGSSRRMTGAALWEALREGLVVPLDSDYKWVADAESDDFAPTSAEAPFQVGYRFLHDRVQQAAYSLIPEAEKPLLHLTVGRLLLARPERARESQFFEIVDHINEGAALVVDRNERRAFAEYNLAAGRRAKAGVAYDAAARYLRIGVSFLGEAEFGAQGAVRDPQPQMFKLGFGAQGAAGDPKPQTYKLGFGAKDAAGDPQPQMFNQGFGAKDAAGDPQPQMYKLDFERDYELAWSLSKERAECEYLSGRPEEAEALFESLLPHARTRMDRARIHHLQIALRHSRLRIVDAIRAGREGLALFGVKVPETDEEMQAAIATEMGTLAQAMASRRIEDLISAPEARDPEHIMQLELFAYLVPPFCVHDVRLVLWCAHAMVNLCLRYGHTDVSPHAYAFYAFIISVAFQRYDEGRRFQDLALSLDEKLGTPGRRCKVLQTVACGSHHFRPPAEVIDVFERALHAGLISGDIIYGCSCSMEIVGIKLSGIEELGAVRVRAEKELGFAQRVKEGLVIEALTLELQVIANLEGRTRDTSTLSDADFDEVAWFDRIESVGLNLVVPYYYVWKLVIGCVHGDYSAAMDAAATAERRIGIAAGLWISSEIPFHAGLAAAGAYAAAPADERETLVARLAECLGKIAAAAERSPAGYGHQETLLRAEMARIEGRGGDARELYDAAIAAARERGNMKIEALASERAAMFYLDRHQEALARVYLVGAQRAYGRWGAIAKVNGLVQAHPSLLDGAQERATGSSLRTVTTTATISSARIDLSALLDAAQALASEIEIERVIERILGVIVASVGAQRAVLMLKRDGGLRIAAEQTVDPHRIELGLDLPALESEKLPISVVQIVERTGEPLLLGDAASDERFAMDRYLASQKPRSVLCLGMMNKGRLSGIVYLENGATPHAFSPARAAFAEFLAAQAAVAVENALLVDEIRRQTQALGEAKIRLEEELLERRSAQAALLEAHEQVEAELAERRLAEQARTAAEEELWRVQTPLIPITDRVMVMPLIGVFDERRAAQLLEVSLHGVHATQAEMVILDITGIKVVDASVADALLRAARALGLLGTEAVLTGMRPDVARQIVELGGDLGGIVTLATLQHGVRYALAKPRGTAKRKPSVR